jgi:hypothetical protein
MSDWSLSVLLSSLHEDIQQRLAAVRKSFGHPGTKGDASENVWISLLEKYLPKRYQAAKAHVVDSLGAFSEQIDVVVFDRQYSPFIFTLENETIIPAESVYAVFEAKQTANAAMVSYAQQKVASVRRLHRTSLPIPYAKGVYRALLNGWMADDYPAAERKDAIARFRKGGTLAYHDPALDCRTQGCQGQTYINGPAC